jgi:hypothetical protein
MTQQTLSSTRRIVLALSLAAFGLGVGCWKPEMEDAEIGCGLDANVNAKCPNRPPADAALPSPADASVAPDTAPPEIDSSGGGATALDTGND